MTLLVTLGLFLTLLAVITAFGYHAYARPARMYQHVGRRPPAASAILVEPKKPAGEAMAKWLRQIGGMLPISPQDAMNKALDNVKATGPRKTELDDLHARVNKLDDDLDRLKSASAEDWWDLLRPAFCCASALRDGRTACAWAFPMGWICW